MVSMLREKIRQCAQYFQFPNLNFSLSTLILSYSVISSWEPRNTEALLLTKRPQTLHLSNQTWENLIPEIENNTHHESESSYENENFATCNKTLWAARKTQFTSTRSLDFGLGVHLLPSRNLRYVSWVYWTYSISQERAVLVKIALNLEDNLAKTGMWERYSILTICNKRSVESWILVLSTWSGSNWNSSFPPDSCHSWRGVVQRN